MQLQQQLGLLPRITWEAKLFTNSLVWDLSTTNVVISFLLWTLALRLGTFSGELDLLCIDEVTMASAHLLHTVDLTLRDVRGCNSLLED